MLPFLLTLMLLASSAMTAAAQASIPKPTKVTKLTPDTAATHAPCHTGGANIQARQPAQGSPVSTWSEPSWVLFNAPTATFTSPDQYRNPKEDKISVNLSVIVIAVVAGSMLAFGIIGCCIKACRQQSGRGKAASKRGPSADVEKTAGSGGSAPAPAARGRHARAGLSRREHADSMQSVELKEAVVVKLQYPAPVYRNLVPPPACPKPQGEAGQKKP